MKIQMSGLQRNSLLIGLVKWILVLIRYLSVGGCVGRSPKPIFLIRHAESMKNVADRFGDPQTRFSLTAKGKNRTAELVKWLTLELGSLKDVLIVSNQEPRAHQTATILRGYFGAPLVIIDGLNPIDSGLLSGLTEDDARRMFPEIMEKKESYRNGILDGYDLVYPGGESVADFQRRVIHAFIGVLRENDPRF